MHSKIIFTINTKGFLLRINGGVTHGSNFTFKTAADKSGSVFSRVQTIFLFLPWGLGLGKADILSSESALAPFSSFRKSFLKVP